jgi:hypothetical protein
MIDRNKFLAFVSAVLLTGCQTNTLQEIDPGTDLGTNPGPDQKNLYWGDIHNHNNFGYARGSIERAYDIAQSHLDFYCFTPHSQWHDQPESGNFSKFTEGFEFVK